MKAHYRAAVDAMRKLASSDSHEDADAFFKLIMIPSRSPLADEAAIAVGKLGSARLVAGIRGMLDHRSAEAVECRLLRDAVRELSDRLAREGGIKE